MKPFRTMLCILSLIFLNLQAQYQFDTLSTKLVGPGVIYTKIKEPNIPWSIDVMQIDLKNPFVKMKTAKAKNLKVGLEKPSVMAQQYEVPGQHVVGIVNADFFIDNAPDNMQVIRGEITRKQRNGYSAVAFDSSNNYMLAYPYFKGSVLTKNASITINDVDEPRDDNELVIYNSYYGTSTGNQTSGTEAVLQPIGEWFVNDTVLCIVKTMSKTSGNTPITKGELVLSAHGSTETLLNNSISIGDTVGIYIEVSDGPKQIKELVGGRPIFYKEGKLDQSITNISVVKVRNPRTIVGFSEDSSKCYLIIVDGRQAQSVGMDVWEMADLMKHLNIYNAMNFDGGGSAVMVINNSIMNSPSDGSERSVSNGLMVVSSEELILNKIEILPDTVVTDLEKPVQYYFSGYNQYGEKQNFNVENSHTYLTNPSIGSFTNNLFYPEAVGKSELISAFGDATDTVIISVEHYEGESPLSAMDDTERFSLTGKEIDTLNSSIFLSNNIRSEGVGSIGLNYSFTYKSGVSYFAYINTDIPINGVPESINIEGLSDGLKHTIAFFVTDENDEEFGFLTNKTMSANSEFETFTAKLINPIKTISSSKFYYPIRLKKIAVALSSSKQIDKTYSGTIYLDNLYIKYADDPLSVEESILPDQFALFQNYPNPFNPTSTIIFRIPKISEVKLEVFNVLGEKIKTLVDALKSPGTYEVEFDAKDFASGIYYYRLSADNYSESRSMIVLK